MFEIISLTQCLQFISDCSLFSLPSEEISVWVETVVLGCCRRLTAAVSVSEHNRPPTAAPPSVPAHFAPGLSSLTWSWVLYETRSGFTEKSGAPPPVLLTQNWPSAPVLEIYSILFSIVFILKAIPIRFTSLPIWYLSTPLFLWLNSLVFFALFTLKKLKSNNIHVNLSKEVKNSWFFFLKILLALSFIILFNLMLSVRQIVDYGFRFIIDAGSLHIPERRSASAWGIISGSSCSVWDLQRCATTDWSV